MTAPAPHRAQRRWLHAGFGLAALLGALVIAEFGVRIASRHWLHLLDVEMWNYAREVKLASTLPGVVEEHRPNANAWLMGTRVETDEHGFRLPDPATRAERHPGDRRVAVVGDSLTFGWGVPEGETYSDQLERLLNRICPARGGRRATVENAGIGNCNTSMELARYRVQVRPLHPEWTIVGFFINDAEPDAVPSTNPLVWRSAFAALIAARLRQGSDTALRDYRAYYRGLYAESQPGYQRMKQAIHDWGALLREDHVAATFILLPELHEPRQQGPFADLYARVGTLAREAGFEVVDPSGAFPPGRGESYWVHPLDAHPNARAQALFAEALTASRFACAP